MLELISACLKLVGSLHSWLEWIICKGAASSHHMNGYCLATTQDPCWGHWHLPTWIWSSLIGILFLLSPHLRVLCVQMIVTVMNIYILLRVRSQYLLGRSMPKVACFFSFLFDVFWYHSSLLLVHRICFLYINDDYIQFKSLDDPSICFCFKPYSLKSCAKPQMICLCICVPLFLIWEAWGSIAFLHLSCFVI